ncbi:non-homologous end joining protein Ku [Palleronia pelagia]|uniref:Non-homologous end joining protein Ku n=1 Tax=Palleronia pelagia TaxID=387096 RepID=A0A1H8DJL9_9RHOB|nr:Ku protein [Palleronia pelagia]SEN07479.1 DNA end-binding protein Ku [Palleronia pelagia]
MAPRAVWTGQLRLSLVAISVELYAATSSGPRLSLRQIHKPSGKRVRYEKVVEGVGPVDRDDIVKGYETDDGEYILLDPDEIDQLKVETSKRLELVQFVAQDEIAPLYYDRPYYMVPKDSGTEDAYRVIRDALRAERKSGLCQITLRGKEHLAAIRPCGDGLLLETLRYAEEIREADPMFSEISDDETDEDMLELATQLIEKKTRPFDASAYSDSYYQALRALIETKREDGDTDRILADDGDSGGGENVVDLMSALKASLDKDEKASGGSSKKKKSSGKKKKAS